MSAGGRHACGIVEGFETLDIDTGNIARNEGGAIAVDPMLGQQKTLRCWGDNAKEQSVPASTSGRYLSISAGRAHTCAIWQPAPFLNQSAFADLDPILLGIDPNSFSTSLEERELYETIQ